MSSANTTTSQNDHDSLVWLIDPVTRQEFERNFYEQQLCLVTRTNPSYYAGLLSAEDLDTVLGTHNITHTEVKLVRGEKDVPQRSYTYASGRIDPLELASRFDEGATIIFGQLHRRVPRSRGCVYRSARSSVPASRPTSTSRRPTPRGSSRIWDTHDVFVLQVAGKKDWSIYDTKVTLPLKGQGFDPDQHEPGPVSEQF